MDLPPFDVHRPLLFEFDPDTGLVTLVLISKMRTLHSEAFDANMRVLLKPEVARALLAYLPELQEILEQATKWNTTPSSLQ